MMTNESSGQILLLLTCLLSVSTELICPDIGFIDSSAQMYCSGGSISHAYINPSGRNVAQCLLTGEGCDTDPSMFMSVLNATHTTLTIGHVQLSDVGTWKCNTGSGEATCHLSVASIPACQITSPRDTSSLRFGEDLLLNISISRYYCSDATPLLLMMGKNDITLFNETVNYTTKEYFVVKQRMTASHFGIVKLFFECGNFRQPFLCEGVQLLGLKYDNTFRSDKAGSIAAIVIGIFIIIIVIIGILLLVKYLRNKNDGRKMCSMITCLPWFNSQMRTVSTSTDDLEMKVPTTMENGDLQTLVPTTMENGDLQTLAHENTMPSKDPKPEVHENTMPAEHPKPEVSEITMSAKDPKPEVHEKTMPAENSKPEVSEITMSAKDPKPEVSEIAMPAENSKPEVSEITKPAEDPKPEVHESTMPAGHPKPEVSEITMSAKDPKPEVHEKTMPAENSKPEVSEKTMSAKDPKPEVSEITKPAEDPKPEVHENTMPAEHPKPEVSEITMSAKDPKPEVHEKTMPAENSKPEVSEITMPAEDPKPEEIHSKTSSSTESTI